ncbi:DinB family protein [Adhaeretor mobilis]|uniref:DinB superfamily protein n=1 Tax=Adhaeretor mobilis TaxID=1930276 RepID=A0A517MZI0_9BACT|nr:DinB family protein [Adhaeretor mobilis]QDT00287.1 DinB superfamily protein [Adhaeretor mobilis]
MNDTFRNLYAFNLGYCEQLMEDIPQEELLIVPNPGVNHPGWQLGHLAVCTDYAMKSFGKEKRFSEEWHTMFGPGSQPASEGSSHPSKQELMKSLREGHAAVVEASHGFSPEQLTDPNPIEFLRVRLPTVADLVAHLMSTHEAAHIGHLSSWRRQTGRPSLFQ